MIRKLLFAVFASALGSSNAFAWGVAHAGYTHVGPAGAYHVGVTERVGPGGATRVTDHVSEVGAGGYRAGFTTTAGYRPGMGTAAYSAGYRVSPGYVGGYRAGVYRP